MLGRDGRLINEQLRRLPEHPQEHSRGRAGSWSRAGFRERAEAAARGGMEGAEVPGAGKGHGDGLGNSSGQMDTQNLGRGGWKRLEKEDGKGLVVSAGGVGGVKVSPQPCSALVHQRPGLPLITARSAVPN